jgi:hypothetical protein
MTKKYTEEQKAKARKAWHKNKDKYNERARERLRTNPQLKSKKNAQVRARNTLKRNAKILTDFQNRVVQNINGSSAASVHGNMNNSAVYDDDTRAASFIGNMKNIPMYDDMNSASVHGNMNNSAVYDDDTRAASFIGNMKNIPMYDDMNNINTDDDSRIASLYGKMKNKGGNGKFYTKKIFSRRNKSRRQQ